MKKFQCVAALALAMSLLVFGSAVAEVNTLDHALSRWLDGQTKIRFSASFALKDWEPFPEETLALFNNALKHASLNVWLEDDADAGLTNVQFTVADEELFTWSERTSAESSSLELSLLPNRSLTSSAASPIDLLLGDASDTQSFSVLQAISEGQTAYPALVSAFSPFAEDKKANYKIKNIGSAKFSKIARLTVEQSTAILDQLHAMLACGMDEAFRAKLDGFTFAKGFVVALYQDANSQDMAVYMKGTLLDAEGKKYNLSYQWAFINEGVKRKDTYKFELKSASKPTDQRIVAANCTQSTFSDNFSFSATTETTLKVPSITDASVVKLDLSGKKDSAGALSINGDMSQTLKHTESDDTKTNMRSAAVALSLTPDDAGAALSGTVEYQSQQDKTPLLTLNITLAEDAPTEFLTTATDQSLYSVSDSAPQSSLEQSLDELQPDDYLVGTAPIGLHSYNVPTAGKVVDLDYCDSSECDALLTEASQNLAGKWLLVVAKLPEEDRALWQDGMTDEDYAAFLALMNAL